MFVDAIAFLKSKFILRGEAKKLSKAIADINVLNKGVGSRGMYKAATCRTAVVIQKSKNYKYLFAIQKKIAPFAISQRGHTPCHFTYCLQSHPKDRIPQI